MRVAVLGAGVNGLGCAVKIKEQYPQYHVEVLANEFSPNTTGDGSAGLWYPYLCGDTHPNKLTKWGIKTYKFMHKLWLEGTGGVSLLPTYLLYRSQDDLQAPPSGWTHKVFGFHQLDPKQLQCLSDQYSTSYSFGFCFTTFTQETSQLLPYLLERFQNAGGAVRQCLITSLSDSTLDDFNIIVNCTGLGSLSLVPDSSTYAIRGQVARVKASWMNAIIVDESSGHYVIPNVTSCVFGGTHDRHVYNTDVQEKDADFIMNGIKTMFPGVKHCEIIKHWVGLRPGRHEVRLEKDDTLINGKIVIHNYGHGGSGVTLFWGCATEVLNILQDSITKIKLTNNKNKSKL